jgi:outer membrane protein
MKKGFMIVAAAITLATACKQPTATDVATTATTTTTAAAATTAEKIAYVNTDTLNVKYQFLIDTKKRLEDKMKGAQKDLEGRAMAVQKEMEQAQANVQNMSPNERETVGARLQKKQEDLERYRQSVAETVEKEQGELEKKFRTKVAEVMKQIATENGYTFVLSYTYVGVGMLYGDPSRDITNKVLDQLNTAYKAEK